MDCQYILRNEIHEKYLLGRLSEAEKAAYLTHVRECESCRRELENQRLLIEGIREAGRREMKREIRRQVEKMRRERRQETRRVLLRIAAVLLFLVLAPGLVYYYQYFAPKESIGLPETPTTAPVPVEKPSEVTAPEGVPLAAPTPEAQPAVVPAPEKQPAATGKSTKPMREKSAAGRAQATTAAEEIPRGKTESSGFRDEKKQRTSEEFAGSKGASVATVSEEMMADIVILGDTIHKSPKINEKEGIAETVIEGSGKIHFRAPKRSRGKEFSPIPMPPGKAEGDIYRFSGKTAPPVGTMSFRGRKTQPAGGTVYLFRRNNQRIEIHLQRVSAPIGGIQKSGLPHKFRVIKIAEDSTNLKMNWQVNDVFLRIDPRKIVLQKIDSRELWIRIPEEHIYRVDLTCDSTKAVWVK